MKAYPPFINYFENMREMLLKCDQTKPRFHAFLKVCQTKPECGRQTLVELLIRPVQRLPSISLLLTGEIYLSSICLQAHSSSHVKSEGSKTKSTVYNSERKFSSELLMKL